MTALDTRHRLAGILGRVPATFATHTTSTRSPVPAIVGSLVAGAILALVLVLGPASDGSEPVITGSVLFAFGVGWALMAYLSARFSAQPQTWTIVPAVALGSMGLCLIVLQPGPAVMNMLSWIWPPALGILAVWMVAQVRQNLRGRGRWLLAPVIATLLLVAVGGGLATVSAATGPSNTAQSGQMVDVGGRRLYIECTGSGSPAVVLQSGLGESSSYWARIATGVAASTTVCVYDRSGHGHSDEAGPQDGIAIATDLHTLLERVGVPGPYVLVGHSSGGPYVRVFAHRYPEQVAGMVLLDSQPADAFGSLPAYPAFYQGYRLVSGLAPSLARIGLLGLALGLPADQSTPAAARGARDEISALPEALEQASALTSIGDRPLIVLSAGSGQQAGWLEAQKSLPSLSTASVQRVLADATHTSIITGADAPASLDAIRDVISSVRSGTPAPLTATGTN